MDKSKWTPAQHEAWNTRIRESAQAYIELREKEREAYREKLEAAARVTVPQQSTGSWRPWPPGQYRRPLLLQW